MKRLLFLCNRGIVSGPMAKALFQHMGPSLLLNWEVTNVIGLCYDNNKGVGTMTILFVMLMIQWLWWWISVIITRRRSMLQPHILDITKRQISAAMGILAIIKILPQVACLATSTGLSIEERDSPKVVALMQVRSLPPWSTPVKPETLIKKRTRITWYFLCIFQKYAVPYTESSPRRVTRKAIASCTFVLASDPGDLQRWFAFFCF